MEHFIQDWKVQFGIYPLKIYLRHNQEDGISLLFLIRQKFTGYCGESEIAFYKLRFTLNYTKFPFEKYKYTTTTNNINMCT